MSEPDDSDDFAWQPHYRRASWPDYAVTPLLLAFPLFEDKLLGRVTSANWKGPILFDAPVHRFARANSRADREFAHELSDALVTAGFVTNLLIDSWVVAGLVHGRPDVAWQMTAINAEAIGVANFVTRMTKRLAARERPYGEDCDVDPDFVPQCHSDTRFRSFISGHTSTSGVLAGLNCAHHQNLSLYGNRMADVAACAGSVTLMVMTGAMRVVSSNHWSTDIVAGGGIGFAVGYLLPTWSYYSAASGTGRVGRIWAVPLIGSGALGLAVSGPL